MAIAFTQEGRKNNLSIIGGVGGINLQVRLYKNNVAITNTTLQGSLTEADYDGYAFFNAATWSAPAVDGGGDCFILSPTIVFTKAAGAMANTIHGYYVTYDDGSPDGLILMAESFASPKTMDLATDQIPLQVLLSERNLAV